MRIAIDASPAIPPRTGIGCYAYQLIRHLAGIINQTDDELLLFYNYFRHGKALPAELNELGRVRVSRIPCRVQRMLHNSIGIPIEPFIGKADVFHSLNYMVPPTLFAKQVVSIHDLTFVFYPETMPAGDAAYFNKFVPVAARRADRVITISESSKRDLVTLLGIDESKIVVTHMAADCNVKPIEDSSILDTVRNTYALPQEYILYVGTLEPRKNIPFLIDAFSALKQQHLIPHKLVIAGKKGWLYGEIFKKVTEIGLENEIVFTGFVEDVDLAALHSAASVFVFPSLYEGFGIPPLEAMACGTPVVVSNTSSSLEVVADAGILLEPHDVGAWVEAIYAVVTKPELAAGLKGKGIERSKLFSWDKTAQLTYDVYRKVCGC
ncbi:MAG: glycosyltransferase family 4 protein [Actinobacteria bacterium]|nr:glycosyltransferase family 4 protein [Actinomycetota bacterium]